MKIDPSSLEWLPTCDGHMSQLDFNRYFCQAITDGMRCGAFTGGGRCDYHKNRKDTRGRKKTKKYSGFSKAYLNNRGSEEAMDKDED
jgi:hypothetical protein